MVATTSPTPSLPWGKRGENGGGERRPRGIGELGGREEKGWRERRGEEGGKEGSRRVGGREERERDGGERSEGGEKREGRIDKKVMGEMIKLHHTEKRTTHAAVTQS